MSLVGLWDSGESYWCVHHRCAVGFGFRLSVCLGLDLQLNWRSSSGIGHDSCWSFLGKF